MSHLKKATAAAEPASRHVRRKVNFSREQVDLSPRWHFWNLVLVLSPSAIAWFFLHRAEKRFKAQHDLKNEIRSASGVGIRGTLVPDKEISDAVHQKLYTGKKITTRDVEDVKALVRRKARDKSIARDGDVDNEQLTSRTMITLLRKMKERLDELERNVKFEGDSKLNKDIEQLLRATEAREQEVESRRGEELRPSVEKKTSETTRPEPGLSSSEKAKQGFLVGFPWMWETGHKGVTKMIAWMKESPEMGADERSGAGLAKSDAPSALENTLAAGCSAATKETEQDEEDRLERYP